MGLGDPRAPRRLLYPLAIQLRLFSQRLQGGCPGSQNSGEPEPPDHHVQHQPAYQ